MMQTSDGIKDLIGIKERLQENLPDSLTYQVLDHLVFLGVKPVVVGTSFFDQILAELLPRLTNNARRKYSNVPRARLIDLLYSAVMVRDPKEKLKLLRACRIERTLLFGSLDRFLYHTKDYLDLYRESNVEDVAPERRADLLHQMYMIEQQVGASRMNLASTIRWAQQGFDLAHTFRQMILEKYVRLAFNEAVRQRRLTEAHVDQEQLFKNLLISVVKAIDKFDPDKGTLTSYIKWWFMDGVNQSKASHEYDIAFSVPNNVRKEMIAKAGGNVNFTVTLDSVLDLASEQKSAEDEVRESEEALLSSRLLRSIDQEGTSMLVMGVPYTLSAAEIAALKSTFGRAS